MQKCHRRIEQIFCTVYFSQPFTMAVLTGVIMKNTTFLARKLDLMDRKLEHSLRLDLSRYENLPTTQLRSHQKAG